MSWVTINPIDDAYISELDPNDNYGSSSTLSLRNRTGSLMFTYMKYTVPCNFQDASLGIYVYYINDWGGSGNTVNFKMTDNDWSEDSITWASYSPSEYGSAYTTLMPDNGVDTWYYFDINSLISTHNVGDTLSFRIRCSIPTGEIVPVISFKSKDEATASLRTYIKFRERDTLTTVLGLNYNIALTTLSLSIIELNEDPVVVSTIGIGSATIIFSTQDSKTYDVRYPVITPFDDTIGFGGSTFGYSYWKHIGIVHTGPRVTGSIVTNLRVTNDTDRIGISTRSTGDHGCPISSYDASRGSIGITGIPIHSNVAGSLGHPYYRTNGSVAWGVGTHTLDTTNYTSEDTFKIAVVQYRPDFQRTSGKKYTAFAYDLIFSCEDLATGTTVSATVNMARWEAASSEKYVEVNIKNANEYLNISHVQHTAYKIENTIGSLPSSATLPLTDGERFTLSLNITNVTLSASLGASGTVYSHMLFNWNAINVGEEILTMFVTKLDAGVDVYASVYENGSWNSISGFTWEVGEGLPSEANRSTYNSTINTNNSFTWAITVKQVNAGSSTILAWNTACYVDRYMSNIIAIKPKNTISSATWSAWETSDLDTANSEIFAGTDEFGTHSMLRGVVLAENIDTSTGRLTIPTEWIFDEDTIETYQLKGEEHYRTLGPIAGTNHTRLLVDFRVPNDMSAKLFDFVYALKPANEEFDWYVNIGSDTAPVWIKAYDFRISGTDAYRRDGIQYYLTLFSRVNPAVDTRKLWAKWEE